MAKVDMDKMVRKATCGACGTERVVDSYMKRTPELQFKRRPDEPTDVFYCGCQDDEHWMDP